MGILKEPAQFVTDLKLPAGFSVCELGHQFMAGGELDVPASEFYKRLGCGRYESVDANGKGTVTADLNRPYVAFTGGPGFHTDFFDLVTDFGTGEHIFDQAQVWRTIHNLTKPGGYIAFDRPSQGYSKHCFYLITAGLIHDLALANGYVIMRLENKKTPRGQLLRGVLRTPRHALPFQHPQQGRYQSSLKIQVAG